jgi:hypothetical protein
MMDGNAIASLFGAQVVAALQFEMEEVFAMTTEGLRGRLLMLQHAQSQGHAPPNADKLIMFLNLELQVPRHPPPPAGSQRHPRSHAETGMRARPAGARCRA